MKKLLLVLFILFTLQTQAQCWKEIKLGSGYAIAIKSDGTLWAWGANSSGQLGDGTTINKTTPVQVGTASDWKTLSAGAGTNLALKSDGTIWVWGDNFYGQIAGGNDPQTTPLQVGTATDWKSISTGGYHMLTLKNNGTLWVWGNNDFGSLGLGNTQDVLEPVQLGTATDWSAVSAGGYSSYALKTNGTLWAWGWNDSGQMGNGTEVGNDASGPNVLMPTQVGTENNWAIICAGSQFIVAQKSDDTLWSWGNNAVGQLGDNTLVGREFPLQIGTDTWTSFSVGNGFCNATKSDGTLYKWGFYDMSTTFYQPTQVNTDTDWSRTLTSGQGYNISVKTNNEIYVWGNNNVGQLGLGDTNAHPQPTLFGTMCEATASLNNNILTQLTLYPNPTSNILNLANADNISIEKLTVIDLTGKIVITQNSNSPQLDVQQLPAGMYFLHITASEGSQHLKFLKQ